MESTSVTLLIAIEMALLYIVSSRAVARSRKSYAVSRSKSSMPKFARYPHGDKLNPRR